MKNLNLNYNTLTILVCWSNIGLVKLSYFDEHAREFCILTVNGLSITNFWSHFKIANLVITCFIFDYTARLANYLSLWDINDHSS